MARRCPDCNDLLRIVCMCECDECIKQRDSMRISEAYRQGAEEMRAEVDRLRHGIALALPYLQQHTPRVEEALQHLCNAVGRPAHKENEESP